MPQFLIYEAKVAVVMAVFYLFFRILLSKENLHRLNRCILLGTVIVSFVLPLCVITVHRSAPSAELQPDSANIVELVTNISSVTTEDWVGLNWWMALFCIYILGIVAFLSKYIVDVVKLKKLIRDGEKHEDGSGNVVIVHDDDIFPFCWIHSIFLSREDFEADNKFILDHERAHIKLGHPMELLIVEILSSMQWFNPAMWLLKSDLKSIYEYEADEAVLRQGADIKEYQYSLIRKAVSAGGFSITNSFNHNILKTRIVMMSKKNVSSMKSLRALYILPLICCTLVCNARTVYDRGNEPVCRKCTVKIEIKNENGNPVYYINGEKSMAEEIGDRLNAALKNKPIRRRIADLSIDDSLNMADVIDLDKVLNKAEILQFYSSDATFKKFKEGQWNKRGKNIKEDRKPLVVSVRNGESALYIMRQAGGDEKEITKSEFEKINSDRISIIEVLNDDSATEKYGDKASAGVVIVTLK